MNALTIPWPVDSDAKMLLANWPEGMVGPTWSGRILAAVAAAIRDAEGA